MKKLLILHNKYQNIGGEDTSVENEFNVLKKSYVTEKIEFNNNIENIILQTLYFLLNRNFKSIKKLKKKLELFNPEIIYIHNTWFKASPAIFDVILKTNSKVYLKLHNFRYDCTRYFLTKNHLKQNITCNKCGQSKKDLGFFNKYYTESYIKSFFINIYGKKYFKILSNSDIDIIVLTNFHKKYLVNLGINKEKISVLPNQINFNSEFINYPSDNYLVYAGRISNEKGVKELIESFLDSNSSISELKIIGTGPMLEELKNRFRSQKISFLGEKPNEEVLKIIGKSKGVVTATKLFEGQPTLLCEASSFGIVSIFPDTGGIKEFFPNSYKYCFEQGNLKDLSKKIKMLENNLKIKEQGNKNRLFLENLIKEYNLVEFFDSR